MGVPAIADRDTDMSNWVRGKLPDQTEASAAKPLGLVLAGVNSSFGRQEPEAVARPDARPLDDATIARLLARLSAPAEPPPTAESGFALREASLPRPRPSRVINVPFPPPAGSHSAPQRPTRAPTDVPPALEVVRYQPEGEVNTARGVSITFSAPMVALDSVDGAVLTEPPVRLDPQPPGEWRWMDPRTLVFEPQGAHMPMATIHSVEIPAETAAASGAPLAHTVRFDFSTPAPRVLAHYPEGESVRPDSAVVLVFDQPVDADAVLAATSAKAGRRTLALTVASAEEVAANPAEARLAAGVPEGRVVALRPLAPLPLDTICSVTLKEGLRSLEGPRTTTSPIKWTFRTPGPFCIQELRARRGREKPEPGETWRIKLSNDVDPASFEESMVSLKPRVERLSASVSGSTIYVTAASVAGQSYDVALHPALRDVFGQTLGVSDPIRVYVGQPAPNLEILGGDHLILDPNGAPAIAARSVGIERIRVRVHSVGPDDWTGWQERRRGHDIKLPGERVAELVLKVPTGGLAWADVDVDLSPWLEGGVGQLIVCVDPKDRMSTQDRRRLTAVSWVQATRLGVDVIADATVLRAWVTDLATGAPLSGATATLGAASAVSGDDGLCTLPLADKIERVLAVRLEQDLALLPASPWSYNWQRGSLGDEDAYLVFDDRGLYRPGEQARLKGWLRTLTGGPNGDVTPARDGLETVTWTCRDALHNEIASGSAPLDDLGGFDITVDLPETVNLGEACVELDDIGCHEFSIAEFRRPEYEVSVCFDRDRTVAGETVTASARAAYYTGGPLCAALVTWSVTASLAHYRPPGWDRFTFGTTVPWWRRNRWDGDDEAYLDANGFQGVTNNEGSHFLGIFTTPGSEPRPWLVSAEATIEDVNRQAWSASASVVVHPSALCVGLRSERSFVTCGHPLQIETVVVDLDGAPMPGVPIRVRAERRENRQAAGQWREVVVETVERMALSGAAPVCMSVDDLTVGQWTVVVEAADYDGRAYRSGFQVWVTGRGTEAEQRAKDDDLQLIPDRPTYAPGDVAEVLIMAPFTPAYGIVLLERDGVIRTEPLQITEVFHTLRIPMEDAFTPGVHVHVVLAGAVARADLTADATQPAFSSGTVYLSVPPVARTLAVGITPRDPGLRPGEGTVLDLVVTGADGAPVGHAGATVIVVDESVLAVASYANPDPLGVFYPERSAGAETARSRPLVLLARPDRRGVSGKPYSGGVLDMDDHIGNAGGAFSAGRMPIPAPMASRSMLSESAEPAPIRARTDFSALALFAAAVSTDANGRAAVPVALPDNLTRYRVLAVATDGVTRFGVGESSVTARLPLMVRPSPPRFLTWGDTFELPVVIQNHSDVPLEVEVAVRAGNATLTAGAGRRLVVAGNDRAEVRFPAATDAVGQARFEVAAASGSDADAATVTLPVWSPATTEAFALHGVLDEGALDQPVQAPAGVVPSFGGLEVTTSSTGVAALADAVVYLAAYPFECAEQLASRVLAIAALRNVLMACGPEGQTSPADLEATVRQDIETLAARQCSDGGFGWWRRTEESWPYISVHVGNALARARAKGFDVPEGITNALLRYLRNIDQRFPRDYQADTRSAISAYAISVRAALGDPDPESARRLVVAGPLSVEGLAWLLPVLTAGAESRHEAKEVRRQLVNRVVETPATASVTARYEDGAHLLFASDRRADAVVLEALIAEQPDSDLIPKLVAGLLGHRTAGRWATTQENAFVLLALGRFFDTYEGVEPDFAARLWLGEEFAGEHVFQGRSTDSRCLVVPMTALRTEAGEPRDLLLAKSGVGRLYYRLGLRYAPAGLVIEPLDRGFSVSRTYEAMDNPDDVRRDGDGTWRIRTGARVRINLTMTARERHYHVALVDPLPAGLEPLDPSLATTASDAASDGSEVAFIGGPGLGGPARRAGHWWWWSRPWFDHENLRDDRAEAFTTLLWEGSYTYRYTARATTPGTFIAGPPKAEEMYGPEVFGRGATDRVVVE